MTRPIRGTLDVVTRALALKRGVTRADARRQLEEWLDRAKPPGGDIESRQVRYRKRGEADVTYTLTEDGEIEHVQLRLGGEPRGRGSERRHRERQHERRAWRDDEPQPAPISVEVPASLRDELDRFAETAELSRSAAIVDACDTAAARAPQEPEERVRVHARIDPQRLERYRAHARAEGVELRTWIRRAIEWAVGR